MASPRYRTWIESGNIAPLLDCISLRFECKAGLRKDRIIEDRGKTGAKGGFAVTNEDGSLVGPWNAMVPRLKGERSFKQR